MNMKKILSGIFSITIILVLVPGAFAANVDWTDWIGEIPGGEGSNPGVIGNLNIGSNTVDVTFKGLYSFAQTNGGTNYWNPATPYIGSTVSNAPPASDIIALGSGGTV